MREARRQRITWVFGAIMGATAIGCAAILGITEGNPYPDGGSDDGGDAGALDAMQSKDAFVVDANFAQCDGQVHTSFANAIYVHPKLGSNAGNCGSAGNPCQTIAQALARAKAAMAPAIYLGDGTYSEALDLVGTNIVVEGGWVADGGWEPVCDTNTTHVESPLNFGARVLGPGQVTLRLMTISSRTNGAPGESVYGLFVSGANVGVDNVALVAQNGGDGVVGGPGQPQSTFCPSMPGNGGPGPQGNAGLAGPLGQAGYAPLTGGAGGVGTNGVAGGGGGAGACGTCLVQCTPFFTPDGGGCQTSGGPFARCADDGGDGCGGAGGGGGAGGAGGGASIALYAWGSSMITLRGGLLATNSAGNGGNGGAGAPGADGGVGSNGGPFTCFQTCTWNGVGCSSTSYTLDGGAGGGPGGPGGPGGQGGGGAGGPTYLFFQGSGAVVNVDLNTSTKAMLGSAGKGGSSNGNAGEAKNSKP